MKQRLKSACTHTLVRTNGPSVVDRGAKLLPTPPPIESFVRDMDRPEGSAVEVEKVF